MLRPISADESAKRCATPGTDLKNGAVVYTRSREALATNSAINNKKITMIKTDIFTNEWIEL